MTDLSYPTFSLSGQAALVTGASRGIGRALALGLAHAGAEVALAARSGDDLDSVADEVRALGRRALVVHLDVTNRPAVIAESISRVANEFGRLDVLVNNAGVEQVCDSFDVDEMLWDRILDTNLKGAFFCAQAAARRMTEGGGGAVLNVCSLTSAVGVPTAVPYGSSKSGLLGMTRALAAEWAARNIRVNGIAPGYFRTALTEAFYQDAAWAKGMRAKIPMGRFGRLDDLIGAAVFLCSDAARYVTGQVLYVDGGYLASI